MRVICCCALLAWALSWPERSVLASERMNASYALSWGGFEVAEFEIALTTDDGAYEVAYSARTTGLAGVLFPFTSAGVSEGQLSAPGPMPKRYIGASERPAGRGSWAVVFGPDGEVERVDVNTPENEERDPVPPRLQKAPDPLALALRATQVAGPGVRFENTSFDGKRAIRFELACDPEESGGQRERDERRVLRCVLDGEVEAGRSKRWDSGRDAGRNPAKVLLSRGIVPGRYWPIRVEAETRFGPVIAELISLR